jgi:hypothetical protein
MSSETAYGDSRPLACPECKLSFLSEDAMAQHRQDHHSDEQ